MRKCHMTIFNQQSFKDVELYREGSDLDVASLQRSFSKYGILPIEKKDFTVKQIEEEVKKLSTADFSGHQLFMCTLLTHGEERQIVSAQDKTFHLRKTIIDPIIQNKTLNGVVKIFIVVACRGRGKFYDCRDNFSEEVDLLSTKNEVDYADTLICYSTVEGHASWRNIEKGTYYIYELCKLIDEKGLDMEFSALLVELNGRLNKLKKQVAIYESTFLKQFFLKNLLAISCDQKTIVMCGETGVGKSTLGNLIVKAVHPHRNSPFKVVNYSMSCPMSKNVVATVKRAEFDVNVIDTPGFGDTEGQELNAMNVCNIWKALETDNVVAVLFVFKSRFTPSTKNWYDRLLKAIPAQHQGNVFIVHTQFDGNDSDRNADFEHIKRLSDHSEANISHVRNMYQIREDDLKTEILHLLDIWTSLPSFTVKNLVPPEIVYEKDEFGPNENRFYEKITDEKPRTEEETRKVKIGERWKGRYGKITGKKEAVYRDRVYTKTIEVTKYYWIEYRNVYRVRYDETRDFVKEEILNQYLKNIEETITEKIKGD